MKSKCPKLKINYFIRSLLLPFSIFLLLGACSEHADRNKLSDPIKKYTSPQYDLTQLVETQDTIHFILDDSTYNSIKSFNLFSANGDEYISFFDERSLSLNIYNFHSQKKTKTISLKKLFKGHKVYKPTAFIPRPDSIFINNNKSLYLIDSTGKIRKKIKFLEEPRYSWAVFENDTPPVLIGSSLFASVRPYMNDESLESLDEWKVLYEFDLKNLKAKLHYHLPELLRKRFYGKRFLSQSHCYNDQGRFVFSFPADSAIYETDLSSSHISHSGKSKFQQTDITSMSRKDVDEDGSKQFAIRDSYGSIYFDPRNKRYLRVALHKVSEKEYQENKQKSQSLIILNNDLEVVGESVISSNIQLNSLFITSSGNIYARVLKNDEYILHFIRLSYLENRAKQFQIAKNEKDPLH